jgi:hypothetical protein
MLNTYIKNRGTTQSLIRRNNHNEFNEINWDADYDGELANLSLTTNTGGIEKHFDVTLDNQDLANMLSTPSINMPIHQRLKMDFEKPSFKHEPSMLQIKLPNVYNSDSSLEELTAAKNYLSSPLPNEELIVPISIHDKLTNKYTSTSKRHHKRKKTHKTYKVYKKRKTSTKSKSKKYTRKLSLF